MASLHSRHGRTRIALWQTRCTKFLVFESSKPRRFLVAFPCAPVCCVRKGSLSLRISLRPSMLILFLPLFARWRSELWDPLTQEPPHTLSFSSALRSVHSRAHRSFSMAVFLTRNFSCCKQI